jgi:molecular chaperone DnaK (HSP70)
VSMLKAPRNRNWIGCIDFGTAMSKAAVVRRKPRTELTSADVKPLAIGARDGLRSRYNLLLPSVIYVTIKGSSSGKKQRMLPVAANAAVVGHLFHRSSISV